MVELADTRDLGSRAARRAGSTPAGGIAATQSLSPDRRRRFDVGKTLLFLDKSNDRQQVVVGLTPASGIFLALWWNWQTRDTQNIVPQGVQVRLLSGLLPQHNHCSPYGEEGLVLERTLFFLDKSKYIANRLWWV